MANTPLTFQTTFDSIYGVGKVNPVWKLYRSAYDNASLSDPKIFDGPRWPKKLLASILMKGLPLGKKQDLYFKSEAGLVKFPCSVNNTQYHSVFFKRFHGSYEPEVHVVLQHIKELSKLMPAYAFWDVGSNWGHHTGLAVAYSHNSIATYAFEPFPNSREDLESFVSKIDVNHVVQICDFALGDSDHNVTISIPHGYHSGIAEISPLTPGTKTATAIRRGDGLTLMQPFLIKIDAEGSEDAIIKGLQRTIQAVRPIVIFEQFLDEKDYRYVQIDPQFLPDYSIFVFLVKSQTKTETIEYDGDTPVTFMRNTVTYEIVDFDKVQADRKFPKCNAIAIPNEVKDRVFSILMISDNPEA